MRRSPSAEGVVGIPHVVCGRQPPSAILSHQERYVLGVVVLVAHHDIEHHPAEHLAGLGIRQSQRSHHIEDLLVGIGAVETVVVMGDAAQRLHVNLPPVLAVKTSGEEMGASVLLHQRTVGHFYATGSRHLVEGIFQTPEVFRFPETCLG